MDQINKDIASLKSKVDIVLNHMDDITKDQAEITKSQKKISKRQEVITQRQEELAKIMAENNVLLRRNMGLFEANYITFPIDSRTNLKEVEKELSTDKNAGIIATMKRILMNGGLKNLKQVLGKSIINGYNYDGVKGKKPLKKYNNFLNALYESVKAEGMSYEVFVKELRSTLHRAKNTNNKASERVKKNLLSLCDKENENKENEDNEDDEDDEDNEDIKEVLQLEK